MVLIGFGLAVFYYVFDSILYIFLSYDVNFFRRLFGPDISEIWSRLTIMCLFVIFGSHAQYTINQRIQAEKALRQSEKKYRNIIETTEDGYYEVDTAGNLTFFNDSMGRIFGYTRQEMLSLNKRMPLDKKSSEEVSRAFNKVFRTGKPVKTLGWSFLRKEGAQRYVEGSISLLKDTDERIKGFSGFIRDVTERKRSEALQQEKMAAETASQAKSEFLAKMSHEIRTPLNSIIGLVELMLDTDLNPQQQEDLDVVISSAYALLSIINNILDFSKIEAGKLDLEDNAFNPREIISESLRIIAMKCHEKGLEVAYRVDENVPDILHGDPTRFRQVLLNLVDNAFKFTDAGDIFVEVKREESLEAGAYLHISVLDTGMGIPHNQQANIFKAFVQADAKTSGRYGGAGLGLAVTAQLVRMMGGRIWVESETGKGSNFHFTTRFGGLAQQRKPARLVPADMFKGVRALIVDDSPRSRDLLVEMLRGWDILADAVSGKQQAIELFEPSGTKGPSYDLVLIDSSLPESGGFALAKWIQSREHISTQMIVMLTFPHLRSNVDLLSLGIAASIMKPVRSSDLLGAISRMLASKKPSPAMLGDSKERASRQNIYPLNILIAEDTPFNQKFILRLLERWGHESILAENGSQVLDLLPRYDVDVILMDVQMPEMDGYEATRAIRNLEIGTSVRVPIITMTAHAIKGDRERCLKAGMDEYLSKPISSDKLFEILEDYAAQKAARIEELEGSADTESPIDAQMLLKAFNHDLNFFREIVDQFADDHPSLMNTIRASYKDGQAIQLSRAAHSLKGMLNQFQAQKASELAAELELQGKNDDLALAKQKIESLGRELDGIEKTLRRIIMENNSVDSSGKA